MSLTSLPRSLHGALLALLPYAALVSTGRAEGGPNPHPCFSPVSAWVAPLSYNRLLTPGGARSLSYPRRDRGRSDSYRRWEMASPGHGGRSDGGSGGGSGGGGRAAGNQGTGGRGRSRNSDKNRGRSADEGMGSLDGSGGSRGGIGGGGSGGGGSSKKNNMSASNSSNNADGGSGGVGEGGGDTKGGRSAVAALERQFSQPAAPQNGGISEGLGKGVPSPTQRLRLQQENLEMRWNMSKKRNQTICCRQCAGEGVEECRFCAGSGLFKIGSELIVDPETGRPPPCPVCRSKGEEVCSRCNGAGRIAAWLFKSERRKWEDSDGSSPPPPSPEPDKR